MFSKKLLATSVLCALAGVAHAQSSTFTFDTNGSASGGSYLGATFDWLPGNALAVNGNPTGGLQNGNVQTLFQANLGTFVDAVGTPIYLNGTSGYYFTAVAGFYENATVTNSGLDVNFSSPTGTTSSFFKIYANQVGIGNNLTGAGFTSGQVIMSGTLQEVTSGGFSVAVNADGSVATDVFDKNGTNNYVGTTTITGSGSTDLTWLISYIDSAFFPDLDLGALITTAINTSLVTPFAQVDPSRAFSSDGVNSANLASNIGTCNGCFHLAGSDLNFQFQADANSSLLVTTIPEPGSLALIGLGLSGLAALRRRARVAK